MGDICKLYIYVHMEQAYIYGGRRNFAIGMEYRHKQQSTFCVQSVSDPATAIFPSLLGESYVGKSNLVLRFTKNEFQRNKDVTLAGECQLKISAGFSN